MSNAVNAMHDLPIRFELSKTRRARVANSELRVRNSLLMLSKVVIDDDLNSFLRPAAHWPLKSTGRLQITINSIN